MAAFEALGFRVGPPRTTCRPRRCATAFLPVGESQLELLEPTDPDSVIARFLEKRSGLHHVCVLVDDIEAALAELKARGVPLVDETPRVGAGGCRVAFVHPKAAAGVLLELKQEPKAVATRLGRLPLERGSAYHRRSARARSAAGGASGMGERVQIGIIGGTGLYEMEGFTGAARGRGRDAVRRALGRLMLGELEGRTRRVPAAPRARAPHPAARAQLPANVFAMKTLGVEWLLSVSAVGSLKEELRAARHA